MRILIIGPPKERDKYTYNLVKMLSRSVTVFPLYTLNVLSLYRRLPRTVLSIKNSNILHLQHYASLAPSDYVFAIGALALLLLARILRRRIVLTMQSPNSLARSATLFPKARAFLWKSYMNALAIMSHTAIVHTRDGMDLLRNEYLFRNVCYIPNWSYPPIEDTGHSRLEEIGSIEPSDKVVELFGIPVPGKGYHHVIEALPKVLREHPHVKLLIAGDVYSPSSSVSVKRDAKAYREYLAGLVRRLNLDNNVIFLGYLPNDVVPKVLRLADIIIFAYAYRPYASGAFSEALSYAKPLVVSDIPAFDMLSDSVNCIKIGTKPEDGLPERIANAIIRLLDDSDLCDKIRSNLSRLLTEDLSPEKFAQAHLTLYRKAVGDYTRIPRLVNIM